MTPKQLKEQKTRKTKADRHESEVASKLGARKTAGSGCGPFQYGDMFGDGWHFEAKSSSKQSIQVREKWLGKLRRQSKIHNRAHIALLLRFYTDTRTYDFVATPATVSNPDSKTKILTLSSLLYHLTTNSYFYFETNQGIWKITTLDHFIAHGKKFDERLNDSM